MPDTEIQPVLDADGLPVSIGDGEMDADSRAAFAVFMAGRVRAPRCPHYMYRSERDAGMPTCERCPTPPEGAGRLPWVAGAWAGAQARDDHASMTAQIEDAHAEALAEGARRGR